MHEHTVVSLKVHKEGVVLAEFQEMPFVLNTPRLKSRILIDSYAQSRGLTLKCIRELTQLDMHFQLTALDYAACFCWTMYIPTVRNMNLANLKHHLNIFAISDGDFNHVTEGI